MGREEADSPVQDVHLVQIGEGAGYLPEYRKNIQFDEWFGNTVQKVGQSPQLTVLHFDEKLTLTTVTPVVGDNVLVFEDRE